MIPLREIPGDVVNVINQCSGMSSLVLAMHIFVLELNHPCLDLKDMSQAIQAVFALHCLEPVLYCREASNADSIPFPRWYS